MRTRRKASWTTYDAERRLEIGRFATTHGVAHASCLGTGPATGPSYDRKFKHFECKLLDKGFENERHLIVHVRTETTFTPQWLTMKECA